MSVELDHVFICTAPDAPEAELLKQFGLREGPPNVHPGQGTANRRFFFANAMLELLWVCDPAEAQNERTRPTQLWERWSGRHTGASPFGICLRPDGTESPEPPFPAWAYRPTYLPEPLALHIAETSIAEPMWVYMSFARRSQREKQSVDHPTGVREVTGLVLTSPVALRSAVSGIVMQSGVMSVQKGTAHLLEIEFDRNRQKQVADFRPHLPLSFRF